MPSVRRALIRSVVALIVSAPAIAQDGAGRPLGVVDRVDPDGTLAVGGGWMRVNADWRYIEVEDDVFNWSSSFAQTLLEADALGIRTSAVVTTGQCWATGFPGGGSSDFPSHPPTDLTIDEDPTFAYSETYYDFVYTFVDHWKDHLDRITVENEVNTQVFWAGTMDEYRRVLATAEKAAHDAAPGLLVFDSGLGSGSWGAACAQWMLESGQYTDDEVLTFANDYYDYDVYAPFSWSTITAFRYWLYQPFVQENNKRVDYVLAVAPEHADGLNFKFTQSSWLLPQLVTWMDARAAELGHTIGRKVNNEASNWPRSSSADEARNLCRMIVLGLAHGVEQALWFPLSNQTTETPRRGLFDEDGDWTDQASAYQNLSDRLGLDVVIHSMDTVGDDVHRFRFRRSDLDDPTLDVLWWDDGGHGSGSESVTFDVPPGIEAVEVFDYLGNPGSGTVVDGEITATISHSPRFFEYAPPILDVPGGVVPSVALGAFPSPFATHVALTVDLTRPGRASLAVFDAAGRRVRALLDASLPAGSHPVRWDGRDEANRSVPAGVYFVRLETPLGSTARRLLRVD